MTKTMGIDVSRWQDNNSTAQRMDFTKSVAKGARFVFIKGSQTNWADEDILFNWKSAKDAGLLRGAYHFLTWDVDPKIQAEYAFSVIKSDIGELPPVCDFEWWGTVPANAYDILWQYVSEMERLCGRKPIIYTGAFFWQAHGTQATSWQQFPLWCASYTDEKYMQDNIVKFTPWDKWTFWQFSASGDGLKYGAESKDLDMNWFAGTYEDLLQFAGLAVVVPPVVPPVSTIDIDAELATIRAELDKIQSKVG